MGGFLRAATALMVACGIAAAAASAASPVPPVRPALSSALRRDLSAYLTARGKAEHISALSVSVSRSPDASLVTATVSAPTFGATSTVTPDSLFQIGSNTKAFTAAAILQLEAERKLSLDQTLGEWLPQYPQWKTITIRRLLDMTSGIPTYDDTQAWQREYAAHPYNKASAQELIAYVERAPLHHGYYYSNTAYLLAQLIIEKVEGLPYGEVLRRRFFGPLGLTHTSYDRHVSAPDVLARTVPGFYANSDPDNRGLWPLLGKDVRGFSLSWAQGAGGVVSSPSDVVRWVRALYQGSVLAPPQRAELERVVSTKTGAPIATTNATDPRGFGLGVVQMLKEPIGRFWFYEGETLGYRVAYAYVPGSNLVFAVATNSQPPGSEDRIGELMAAIYTTLQGYAK